MARWKYDHKTVGETMLKKIVLSEQGFEYIQKELIRGSSFAKLVLNLPLTEGTCETLIPEMLDTRLLTDFSNSIYLSSGLSLAKTKFFLIEKILKFLQDDLDNCVIIETFLKSKDAALTNRIEPYIVYGEDVYYFLTYSTLKTIIESALADARAYPKIIAFTKYDSVIPNDKTIQFENLEVLARNLQLLVVGAYDEEGYIFWSKKEIAAP
jgi:hypothetical protein